MNTISSGESSFCWELDHEYRDSGVRKKALGYQSDDQFASKVAIDRNQQWGLANGGGIRVLSSGSGGVKNKKVAPLAVFLVSRKSAGTYDNPWVDSFDPVKGILKYWGDAKCRGNHGLENWKGNRVLRNVKDLIQEGRFSEVPPILYFIRRRVGWVTFKGLFVLKKLERRPYEDKGQKVENYFATLSMLAVNQVKPCWLVARMTGQGISPWQTDAPSAWLKYQTDGTKTTFATRSV